MNFEARAKSTTEEEDVEAEVASALALIEELSIKSSDSGLSEETCWDIFGGPCPENLRKKIKSLHVDESVEEEEDFFLIEESTDNKNNKEQEDLKSNDVMNIELNKNLSRTKTDADPQSSVEEKLGTSTPEVKSILYEKKDSDIKDLKDKDINMTLTKNEEFSKKVSEPGDGTKNESNGDKHPSMPISMNNFDNKNLAKEELSLKNNLSQLSKSSQEMKMINTTSILTQENELTRAKDSEIQEDKQIKSKDGSKISGEIEYTNDEDLDKQVSLRSESRKSKQEKTNSQEHNRTAVIQGNLLPEIAETYKDSPIGNMTELEISNNDAQKTSSFSTPKNISPSNNLENNRTDMNVSKISHGTSSTKSINNIYKNGSKKVSPESSNGKSKKIGSTQSNTHNKIVTNVSQESENSKYKNMKNTQDISKRTILTQEISKSEELIKTEDLQNSEQNLRQSVNDKERREINSVDIGISASIHKNSNRKSGSGTSYKVVEEIKKTMSPKSRENQIPTDKKQQTSTTKTTDRPTSVSQNTLESNSFSRQVSSLDNKSSTSLKTSLSSNINEEKMYQINETKECNCVCCVDRQIRKSFKKDLLKCTCCKTKHISCRCCQSFEKCHIKIFDEKEVDDGADCREHFLQITSFSGDKTTFSNKKVQTSIDNMFNRGIHGLSGSYMHQEFEPLCPCPDDKQPAYSNKIRNRLPPRQYNSIKQDHGAKNKWRDTSSSSDITEPKEHQKRPTEGFRGCHVSSTNHSLVGALTSSILKRSVKDTVKNFEKNRLFNKHIPNYQQTTCMPRNILHEENIQITPKPFRNETCGCCNKPKQMKQRQFHQQIQKPCVCCSYKNKY